MLYPLKRGYHEKIHSEDSEKNYSFPREDRDQGEHNKFHNLVENDLIWFVDCLEDIIVVHGDQNHALSKVVGVIFDRYWWYREVSYPLYFTIILINMFLKVLPRFFRVLKFIKFFIFRYPASSIPMLICSTITVSMAVVEFQFRDVINIPFSSHLINY